MVNNVRRQLDFSNVENTPERVGRPTLNQPDQTASNTVLFEMMMHYKRKMEDEQEISRIAMKKLKRAHDAVDEMAFVVADRDQQIRQLTMANMRGAALVMQKHEAGMRIVTHLQDLYDNIDLVYETELGGAHLGMNYIYNERVRSEQRAGNALQLFLAEPQLEIEEIDLTGEETETEEEDN